MIPLPVPFRASIMHLRSALDECKREVALVNGQNGWRNPPASFGEYIALLHSEVSEVLEAYRSWKLRDPETGKPEGVGSELADVFIRLIDMCELYNIDLAHEYSRKMEYNRRRPYRHGGKTL